MTRTRCTICGQPVITVGNRPATCSAACALASSSMHELVVDHREWLILRNAIASATPGVPRVVALACGTVRLLVVPGEMAAREAHTPVGEM